MLDEGGAGGLAFFPIATSVKKRPGMYFGGTGSSAVNNAIYELISNAIDQYLMGYATKVKVEVFDSVIKVSDDGRGLPFNAPAPIEHCASLAEFYFLYRHNLPTADNHAPHVHILSGGLGLAVINAASDYIKVISSDGHRIYRQEFGEGAIQTPCEIDCIVSDSGTELEFFLDKTLFQVPVPDMPSMRKTLFELAHFYPGLVVEFQGERFLAERGLLDLAYIRYSALVVGSLSPSRQYFFQGKENGVQIQVAALGDSGSTEYKSWVNGVETVEGGVHILGLERAFLKVGWKPHIALIHVILHDPKYAGPSRDTLCHTFITEVVEKLVEESLFEIVKNQRN
ncbi:hypothetical protein [Microbulbifer variabilis]|uniref:hypothetical protein n=1 Tax=Microbulbifer variabilis TaxID=266805 RepID=UPI001CFC5F75|nr:hypothetical protein [Microbulbifer variabilis]